MKPRRASAAAALPGKSLVVFDPRLGIACDVFPCEDGHAQERRLLGTVSATVMPNDRWIADRNVCVNHFLCAITRASAAFVIREHAPFASQPLAPMRHVGTSPTAEVADATTIAGRYRGRWTIETAFQRLERHLHSELNTLGYPQAALFGFCLALVAFKLDAVVMAALRVAHPSVNVDDTLSEYYLAAEIANTTEGMNIAVDDHEWARFADATQEEMCPVLLDLAQPVDLVKLRKTTRGPKKPPTPRTQYQGKTHVSTATVLAGT